MITSSENDELPTKCSTFLYSKRQLAASIPDDGRSSNMDEKVAFIKYRLSNPEIFKNKVISMFFCESKHISMLGKVMIDPTNEIVPEFEEAFRKVYFNMRFAKYVSSMIRYATIDYHRKHKLIADRNRLIFDAPYGDMSDTSWGEQYPDPKTVSDPDIQTYHVRTFHSSLENPELRYSFSKLSDRQQVVITLYYSVGETDAEIAQKLNVSQQAVSKMRNSALKKMQKHFRPSNEVG